MPGQHRQHIAAALVDITPTQHGDHTFCHVYDAGDGTGASLDVEAATERGAFRVFELGDPDGEDGGMATVSQVWHRERIDLRIGYGSGPEDDAEALRDIASSDARAIVETFRNGATWVGTDVDLMVVGSWRVTRAGGADGPRYLLTVPLTVHHYD